MDNEVMIREQGDLSVEQVAAQVGKIQTLMKSVMKENEHFGVIPGTGSKPSLLQPGAEKINFMFRFAAGEPIIEETILNAGHKEYRVKVPLIHIPTGSVVGWGVGSCSTMESKYRYREDIKREVVGPVPKPYWDARNQDGQQAADAILVKLYGKGNYRTKKHPSDGWQVIRVEGTGEKIENPDIADTYNTVLKMAYKRAYVSATLRATAASDFFTQDVEDMPQFSGEQSEGKKEPSKSAKPSKVERETPKDYFLACVELINNEVPQDQRAAYMDEVKAAKDNEPALKKVYDEMIESIGKQPELDGMTDGV